uniref:Uncharacterized protein n=1 Tax=Oryzias sinensis TaxID=183150 RepID=A0A8C7X5R8_9TELE
MFSVLLTCSCCVFLMMEDIHKEKLKIILLWIRGRRKNYPMHKKARLEFSGAHAEKDEDYWDSILWSDESPNYLCHA